MSLRLPMGLEEIPEPLVLTIPVMSHVSVCGHHCHTIAGSEPPYHTRIMHSSHVMGTTLGAKKSNGRHSPTSLPPSVYPKPSIITDPGSARCSSGFPEVVLAPPSWKGHCEGLVLE